MKIILKNVKKLITLLCLILLVTANSSFVCAKSDAPDLTAKAALLFDVKTGKILYNKNENERMYPASTTKIMTAILTLENCNLDDIVTVKTDIDATIPYGYTIVELQVGERFTVEQLMELLMVHSANDVANLLAEHVGGSMEGFISMMNAKVEELNLSDTHFTNPSGIHDDNHYTTARDLATIMEYCIKNEDFRRFSKMSSCNIPATNKHSARAYESTNKLLLSKDPDYYPYIVSGKTGYTTESGGCLVSCADKNNIELLCVVLGSETIDGVSTRYNESKLLYEYGYNNYSMKTILNKDEMVSQITVNNGNSDTKNLDLLANDNIDALIDNDVSIDNLDFKVNLNENIKAPISQGDVLGNVTYNVDDVEYKTDLVASHAVEESKLIYYMIEILVGVALIIIVLLIFLNKKKKKSQGRYYYY